MDAQTVIEKIQSNVKDKTLLVRFYNLHNGTDLWIDGVNWYFYDFDMREYLHEEYGIDLPEGVELTYDVLDASDDFIKETCFVNGVFKTHTRYEEVQKLLVDYSESAISACLALGIDLENMGDAYRGQYESLADFCKEAFETPEIPERFLNYIDWERYAEDNMQDYSFENGYVFYLA